MVTHLVKNLILSVRKKVLIGESFVYTPEKNKNKHILTSLYFLDLN